MVCKHWPFTGETIACLDAMGWAFRHDILPQQTFPKKYGYEICLPYSNMKIRRVGRLRIESRGMDTIIWLYKTLIPQKPATPKV
jgi:hypothetical protein